MDRLLSMRTFEKVVAEGSFAAAARRMSLNQAVVTRLVADLESHLGTRLLNRTTRSLSLTDAGERYLQSCRKILADVESAEEMAGEGTSAVGGTVRIAAPPCFALTVMAPRGPKFHARFPDIVTEVFLVDRPVDLVMEGFDLAVVPSTVSVPSSVIVRKLANHSMALCASRAYLSEAGTPRHPEDLRGHACIGYTLYPPRDVWKLTNENGETASVPIRFAMQSNSLAYVRQAIRAGLGIGQYIRYGAEEPFSDEITPVLPQWTVGDFDLNIVYPSREYLPRRVRAVIDFFVEERNTKMGQCEVQRGAMQLVPSAVS